jgi:hypothetical protein
LVPNTLKSLIINEFVMLLYHSLLPRIVPAIILNQSFDVPDSVEVVVNKVNELLRELRQVTVSYVADEFVWCCQKTCGLSSVGFEIRVFRYSKRHAKAGLLMVEMQRLFGDRMQYFTVYDTLRGMLTENRSIDCQSELDAMPEVSEAWGFGTEREMEGMVSELDIKSALLSTLSHYDSVTFELLSEAVQLAGTVFAPDNSNHQLSNMDMQLLSALETLSIKNPQFHCIRPFVVKMQVSSYED